MTSTPIEELLNLTPLSEIKENEFKDNEIIDAKPTPVLEDSDDGVIEHSGEMNEVYSQALKAHKEIVDTAMQVEARHMGAILEQSAKFLEIALNASSSKQKSKESSSKLKIAREKLKAELKTMGQMEADGVLTSNGVGGFVADRNSLLKAIKENKELD